MADSTEPQPVTDRKVKSPGMWITLRNLMRRSLDRLRALKRSHKLIAAGALGALLVVVIIVLVAGGDGAPKVARGVTLAKQGQDLLNAEKPKQAAELIESALIGKPQPEDGDAYLVLGHARFAMKRYLEALTAYER